MPPPRVHGPIRATTSEAGSCTTTRPVTFIWTARVLEATYAAMSSAGRSRSLNRWPTERVSLDPVDAEGAPVVALEVEGDEVPAAAPVHEAVGLHLALRGLPGVVGVGEPDDLAVAGGGRDQGEQPALDAGPREYGATRTVWACSASTR